MKINKSNQSNLINSITGKLLKIASMNVYVQDFQYPTELNTLNDIARHAETKLPFNTLSEEEKKNFISQRTPEVVTIDGLDVDSTSGIINFYTAGLNPTRVEEFLDSILSSLKQAGAENIGELKREKSKMFKSDVIRIPVGSITKKEVVKPPELNMANANATHIFQGILKYQFGEGSLVNIDANDLIKRIDYYLGEKQLPETPNRGLEQKLVPWKEGDDEYQKINTLMGPMKEFNPVDQAAPSLTIYHGGYDDPQVRQRLQEIKRIAQWALKNGYQKIAVY